MGESELAENQRTNLTDFLEMQKDSAQRFFEVKAAIKLVLGSESFEEFGTELEEETDGVSRVRQLTPERRNRPAGQRNPLRVDRTI